MGMSWIGQYLFERMQGSFQKLIGGEPIRLNPEQFMNFKVVCSSKFTSLKQWLQLAGTIYKVDVDQCLDLLAYVERHEIPRQIYRDYTHANSKIRVYNCLAALHLCKDNQAGNQEKGRMFADTKKYINMAESVKNVMGKTSLTLRGFIHYHEGSFQESLASFTRAAETHQGEDETQSVIGMLGLAQILFTKRNYEGALNFYKKALRVNKRLPSKARLGMAYCFYELEKYEMALLCFKRLLDLEPNCVEAILGYATIKYESGETEGYFPALKRCYEINPCHPLVLLHISEHFFLIQSPNTEKFIEKGLKEVQKMPSFIDTTDELRNDKTIIKCKLNYLMGQQYHKRGEYDICLKYYSQALNKSLPYVRINFARAYINSNNYTQACKLIEDAIRMVPPKSKRLMIESYKTLAYIKSKAAIKKDRSEISQSIDYYGEFLKYNSNDYESFIECGNVLLENDLKRCESCYHSAYEILKAQGKFIYPELLNNLGVLNALKKEESEAEKYYLLAFDQLPEWSKISTEEKELKEIKLKAYTVTLNFNLGILYEESCRFTDAIEAYTKCLTANPLYLDVYIRLAFLHNKRGSVSKALTILEQAEEIVEKTKNKYIPKDSILLAKSYIFKTLGDERKAKEILKDCHNQPYKKVFEQSLEYEMLIERGESNTRNLKEILKQKIKPGLKIIQEDPHNFYGVLFFGVLAATLEKPIEAMICLNSLKQMDTQHPIILLNLGIYHYNTQQHDKALILLKKYVDKVDQVDTTAQMLISFILIVKGKFQEAIKIVKRLVMLFPENMLFRYQLAFFIQKLSEKFLDAENREIKKVSQAIAFIKKIKLLYAFLSRIRQGDYVAHIENPERREKLKEELLKIREKSDEQKMYIKSREDKFAFYENDAIHKEKISHDERFKILNKTNEIRERKQRMMEQEQRQKEEEMERRREKMLKQREIEARLNEEYLQEQQHNDRGKEERKMRQGKGSRKSGSKKKRDDYEFVEPGPEEMARGRKEREDDQGDDNNFVEAPKRSGGRLKKKARNDSSDEEKYEVRKNEEPENEEQGEERAQNEEGELMKQEQDREMEMEVESPPPSEDGDAKQRRLLSKLQQDEQ